MAHGEILTIQLGEFSNFIGSHWWNLQGANSGKKETNEVDHSVFFRQGTPDTNGAVSWIPRLISVDLKGCLDFPSEKEEFPISVQCDSQWKSQQGRERIYSESSMSHDLEIENSQWREFLNYRLHPHSLNLLPGYQYKNPVDMFNLFPLGLKCMEKEENLDSIENQVRFFMEECDYFQGFHLLLDANNGFGGVAAKFLQLIKQEYSSKTIYAIPSLPACMMLNSSSKAECLTNIGFAIESLFDESCMLSPVSLDPLWCSENSRKFNHLQYKPNLYYHSSAIIATTLDTVTLPLRTKNGPNLSLMNFVRNLTINDRKAVGISSAIPLPDNVFNFESLNSAFAEVVSLTPCVQKFRDSWTQSLVWRGILNPSEFQPVVDSWSCSKWERSLTKNSTFRSISSAYESFPDFLKLNRTSTPERYLNSVGLNFPILGGLHNSASVGDSLNKLHFEISKTGVKKLQHFLSSGMEEDELLENRDRILSFAERYDEN